MEPVADGRIDRAHLHIASVVPRFGALPGASMQDRKTAFRRLICKDFQRNFSAIRETLASPLAGAGTAGLRGFQQLQTRSAG